MKLRTLLKFGWCGNFRDTGILMKIIMIELKGFTFIKFVDDKIFAHVGWKLKKQSYKKVF